MTYGIVGASAGVGRALAERFAAAGHDLVLAASDARDVNAVAANLAVRHGRRVIAVAADVRDTPAYLHAFRHAVNEAGGLDGLLLPIGVLVEPDDGRLDPEAAARVMHVNFTAVYATIAAFLPVLKARRVAAIVGFGSIAAARGRGRNIVYAAAKRALESCFESLRHQCAGTPVVVQLYVLGYMDTAMAYGRPTPVPPAGVERLSARVLCDIHRDVGVVYYPWAWRWITLALRLLPWSVYRRLSF